MRKDTSVIKRILRSLPIDVVKKNLAHVWKVYKSMYGTKYVEESLGHVNIFYENNCILTQNSMKKIQQQIRKRRKRMQNMDIMI